MVGGGAAFRLARRCQSLPKHRGFGGDSVQQRYGR